MENGIYYSLLIDIKSLKSMTKPKLPDSLGGVRLPYIKDKRGGGACWKF